MIRSCARSFGYSPQDLAVRAAEFQAIQEKGIQGFLLGCLTPKGEIDRASIRVLQNAGGNRETHFQLAWEQTQDPMASLDLLMELGIKSVRPSGGSTLESQAPLNPIKLRTDAGRAVERIEVFLAGGIRIDNLAETVRDTGSPMFTLDQAREIQNRETVCYPKKKSGDLKETSESQVIGMRLTLPRSLGHDHS